jgi:hypothetical protein
MPMSGRPTSCIAGWKPIGCLLASLAWRPMGGQCRDASRPSSATGRNWPQRPASINKCVWRCPNRTHCSSSALLRPKRRAGLRRKLPCFVNSIPTVPSSRRWSKANRPTAFPPRYWPVIPMAPCMNRSPPQAVELLRQIKELNVYGKYGNERFARYLAQRRKMLGWWADYLAAVEQAAAAFAIEQTKGCRRARLVSVVLVAGGLLHPAQDPGQAPGNRPGADLLRRREYAQMNIPIDGSLGLARLLDHGLEPQKFFADVVRCKPVPLLACPRHHDACLDGQIQDGCAKRCGDVLHQASKIFTLSNLEGRRQTQPRCGRCRALCQYAARKLWCRQTVVRNMQSAYVIHPLKMSRPFFHPSVRSRWFYTILPHR